MSRWHRRPLKVMKNKHPFNHLPNISRANPYKHEWFYSYHRKVRRFGHSIAYLQARGWPGPGDVCVRKAPCVARGGHDLTHGRTLGFVTCTERDAAAIAGIYKVPFASCTDGEALAYQKQSNGDRWLYVTPDRKCGGS